MRIRKPEFKDDGKARNRLLSSMGLFFLTCGMFAGVAAASQNYTSTVDQVQWAVTTNCLYFSLVGVSVADPVVPGSPWFAIPLTQTGFTQLYSLILSAKVAGSTVNAATTGGLAGGTCGTYAAIGAVTLQ